MTFDEYLEHLKHGNINQRASAVALEYAQSAYPAWVIDQMLRIIAGGGYTTLMEYYNQDGRQWNTGQRQKPEKLR